MLKIAICDDEKEFTGELDKIVKNVARENGIQIDIDVFFTGEELLKSIELNDVHYDLIFLDIEMKKMNGLDVARKIRKRDELVFLIYVTSHKSYAIEAYEVHPFQFAVKPIDPTIIEKYFLKVYEKINAGNIYFEYKFQKDYYKLIVNDIMYFESDKRLINIYMVDGTVYTYYDKLNLVEEQLKRRKVDFWRISRSVLVNARFIRKKAYDHVELVDGFEFSISIDRRKEINEQYAKSVEEDMIE